MTLPAPPLSAFGRSHSGAERAAYASRLAAAQAQAVRNVRAAIPSAQVRWRYRLVLNGFAVVVPSSQVARLARVPGIRTVWPSATYHSQAIRTPEAIGADKLWGLDLATAGAGVRIGIIDDGVDASHPFFDGEGMTYPKGFPRGQTSLATPKVIVQRTFAPASPAYASARTPFDRIESFHATHVAGIAAGNHATPTGTGTASGVAPKAYIGNYKALTIPTPEFGLDGNAPEITAAIEAAVADGMDVINVSLGEPEVEPSRDIVVAAIEGAARAGVVPVVAAGNDYSEFRYGSVGSPANAPSAITVGAVSGPDAMASFSSAGPTPISLTLKPDVSAPGVGVVSSTPRNQGDAWSSFSGTSMASPHVAGGAALLRQQRPSWTVAQIKSALVQTADLVSPGGREVSVLRQGNGVVNLPHALDPLLFASPTSISFPTDGGSRTVSLANAGGGDGTWSVAKRFQGEHAGIELLAPKSVDVPGRITVSVTASEAARTGAYTGFVVLTRGADVRRVPFLLVVSRPVLGTLEHRALRRPGTYTATTKGGSAKISRYRWPTGMDTAYPGPEVVYRIRIARPVANFGVAVVSGRAEPHVMRAGDENRLTGYAGLPVDLNPYFMRFGSRRPIAGAILPRAGAYDIVFDTRSAAQAGPFTFRFWVNDMQAPRLRLAPSAPGTVAVAISDGGSGVDPSSIQATVDGRPVTARFEDGRILLRVRPGTRHVVVTASDYQEAKNMEDVHRIKPNTRTLDRTVVVRAANVA